MNLPSHSSQSSPSSHYFNSRALAALLILLTLAAYLPAIRAGYIWDDDTLLTANPQMRSLDGLAQIWRGEHSRDYTPLTLTTFWLEWQLWDRAPTGYHVVNILLHALCALLLWRILERLRVPGAWLGALLFAIHPVNVASVAWIAELKNTLSSALFLGSILSYLTARDRKRLPLYLVSLALFLLAALSKGAVVTMPAVLLLCVLWKDRKLASRDLWQVLPYALIAAAAALLTIRYQARAQHYGLLPDSIQYRIARAGASVWYYLGALLWPAGRCPMRPPWLPDLHSPLAWFPALAAAAALVFLFWKRRTFWGRPLLFAYACFLIMLLPVLGFIWMTLMQQTPGADWWQYMAAPAIFACVAAGVVTASRKWRPALPLFAILVALLFVQTWRRATIYQSLETYCRAVTAGNPHAWTLQNNLGILLKRQGRFADADACFHQALRDNPGYVEAHVNLANSLGAAGDLHAAEAELRQAAQMRPGDPDILENLAGLCYTEGRSDEALALQSDSAKADPRNPGRLFKLGGMLVARSRFPQAEACYRNALTLAPDSIALRIGLCQALVAQNKTAEALQICSQVDQLARQSSDPDALAAAAKLRQTCHPSPTPPPISPTSAKD